LNIEVLFNFLAQAISKPEFSPSGRIVISNSFLGIATKQAMANFDHTYLSKDAKEAIIKWA